MTVHTVLSNVLVQMFWLVSRSYVFEYLLCFVHGQGQRTNEIENKKPITKKLAEFHNQFVLITIPDAMLENAFSKAAPTCISTLISTCSPGQPPTANISAQYSISLCFSLYCAEVAESDLGRYHNNWNNCELAVFLEWRTVCHRKKSKMAAS